MDDSCGQVAHLLHCVSCALDWDRAEMSGSGRPSEPPNHINGPSSSVSLLRPIQTTQPLGFSASARPTENLPAAWVFS